MIAALIYLGLAVAACLYFITTGGPGRRKQIASSKFIATINNLLPQTQCGECGYTGCKPYAAAIALNKDDLNRCPPGEAHTVRELARLTGKPALPPANTHTPNRVAFIEEELCIGCVKCIQACPVDAIIGAAKQMHGVIPQYCTGCELCVAPCPVDCIVMKPARAKAASRPALLI